MSVMQVAADRVESRLIEAEEVGQIFGGVSKRTIWRWADSGILPKGVRLGGKRFWPRSVIEAAMAKLEAAAV